MSEMQPNQEAPRYQFDRLTPEAIEATTTATITRANMLVTELAEARANPTFEATLGTLDEIRDVVGWEGDCGRVEQLMRDVHPDKAVRDAAKVSQSKLQTYFNSLFSREDLYAPVAAFAQTDACKALPAESEEARLVADTLLTFKRTGQDLDPTKKTRLQELLTAVNNNSSEFLRNIGEDNTTLTLTAEELDGLPEAFVQSLVAAPDNATARVVTMQQAQVDTILQLATNRGVREKVWSTFNSVGMENNKPLIAQTAAARHEIAQLLGYESWADLQLQGTMAGNPATVNNFHDSLKEPLLRKATSEVAAMQPLLAADGYDGPIQAYDTKYYAEKIRQRDYGINAEQISEYLPLDTVRQGLFALTSEMYGITYEEVTDAAVWHEDVKTYRVKDATTGEVLGTFHHDPFPRAGKIPSGAVTYTLSYGHKLSDGGYQQPEMALVTNFSVPANGRPCLLKPTELKTFFHEHGHVLHGIFARTNSVRFAGTKVERDFVEAPSQIMEHWAASSEIVQAFARHYQSGEAIPAELISGLEASQNVTVGLDTIRNLQLGIFDMRMHDASWPKDIDAIYEEATAYSGTPIVPNTFWPGRFVHPYVGYDAGYYGYIWAKVDGDDMFSVFEAGGLRNPNVGRAFRQNILQHGGSVPAINMVRTFLGRDPNQAAFLHNIGATA